MSHSSTVFPSIILLPFSDDIAREWLQNYAGEEQSERIISALHVRVLAGDTHQVKTQLTILLSLVKQPQFVENIVVQVQSSSTISPSSLIDKVWTCLEKILANKTLETLSELVISVGSSLVGHSPLPYYDSEEYNRRRTTFNLDKFVATDVPVTSMSCETFCKQPIVDPATQLTAVTIKQFACSALPNLLSIDEIIDRSKQLAAEPMISVSSQSVIDQLKDTSARIRMDSKNSNRLIYDCNDEQVAKVAAAECRSYLSFESRFECGNLWRAIALSETEYDLMIDSDVNCDVGKHNQ